LLIYNRSRIFSRELDQNVEDMGVEILKIPVHGPKANVYCERLIDSLYRECADRLVPVNGRHLRIPVPEWVVHYSQGRQHKSLGTGIPDPPSGRAVARQIHGHEVPDDFLGKKRLELGGLHHEYRLERIRA
jgi:transposase InsO family protein